MGTPPGAAGIIQPKGPAQCMKMTCGTCGFHGPPDPQRPGCVVNCPHKGTATATATLGNGTPKPNGNGSAAPRGANGGNVNQPAAEYDGYNNGTLRFVQTQFGAGYPPGSPNCAPGAPYPCYPTMDPRNPSVIYGAGFPLGRCGCTSFEEAVKALCYVGASLYVPTVGAGLVVSWRQSVKWWWQMQHKMNLGDQENRSFRLTRIHYGKSEFQLDFQTQTATVGGVAVVLPPGEVGIDIRRWNMNSFANKNYPFPASALDDEVTLEWTNVSAGNATLDLDFGGAALLQN